MDEAHGDYHVPAKITTPDQVETSIGTLRFIDGAPLPETARLVYDDLDRMRGVDAFLKGIPGASLLAIIEGLHSIGAVEAHQVAVTKDLANANQLLLTAGTSSMYAWPSLDLEKDGPVVVDVPAGVLGMLDDAWFRDLEDFGPLGPDKGEGGLDLILPPGYEGEVPEGYFTIESPTYRVWYPLRSSMKQGAEAAYNVFAQGLKIYPLSRADDPPAMEFVNMSEHAFNTVHANNFEFYEEIDRVIQKEPLEFLDPETRGLYASIGIEKGKPFAPDARMKRILEDAVAIGNATLRSLGWYPRTEGTMKGVEHFPGRDSHWILPFLAKNVFFNGEDGRTMNSDARAYFHYYYTAVTPAMAVVIPGKGSDYAMAFVDADGQPFDGAKTYKLHLPPDVPVVDFWSVTLFDTQTRSMLLTDQPAPAIQSFEDGVEQNPDGSFTVWFGPTAPEGHESNWLQTVPGKSWFLGLRMYGPTNAWIDKEWQPGEVELVG